MKKVLRYKLTDSCGYTRNSTEWGAGITHRASGMGDLCGPGWIHEYSDPLLAVFFNEIHSGFKNPRMCEVWCSLKSKVTPTKEGWTRVEFKQWIPVPEITLTQRVAFGILCAKEVNKDNVTWLEWADNWLSGIDRSYDTAYTAVHTADCTYTATRLAAVHSAAHAARAAAHAAAHNAPADYAAAPSAAHAAVQAAACANIDLAVLARVAVAAYK